MLKITKLLINNGQKIEAVDAKPFFTLYIESDSNQVVPTSLTAELQDITKDTVQCLYAELDPKVLHDIQLPDSMVLCPHHSYRIRFRMTDSDGDTCFSCYQSFRFAYESGAQWTGSFISADCPEKDEEDVTPVYEFLREFEVTEDTTTAYLYITALGVYMPFLNGRQVGNNVLTPGWFTYYKHLAYQVYDVLPLLRSGRNTLSVLVGDGWYKGYLTSSWHRNYYGSQRQLLWEIHLHDCQGRETVIVSDSQSCWRKTSILMSEIYCGEICDRTLPQELWSPVQTHPAPEDVCLHASIAEPCHYLNPVIPKRILHTPNGETVVDFGQVMSGVVEVTASLPRGTKLLMEFGDNLDPDGNFYNDNVELFSLRGNAHPSVQKISYTFAGGTRERYRPTFTYQGFRYMRISGTPKPLALDSFVAYPISSFTNQTGKFICGDEMINRIFENTIHTEYATFIDIPIAGPNRAERLGWTGDNQLMFPLALRCMFESYRFLLKWLEEVRHSQSVDGQVGTLAPYVNFEPGSSWKNFAPEASAIWGDAAVICPWLLYEFYGDVKILQRYRELAKGYVDYMRNSGDCEITFTKGETFGDWFALDNGDDAYHGKTDKAFLGDVYYYHSTEILCRILRALGDPLEVEYADLAQRICEGINSRYFENGRLIEPTQTSAALVLAFGIGEKPEKVAEQLCGLLEQTQGHLVTGFAGTSVILQALCNMGRPDLALEAVAKRDYPSWIYTIEKGATTIWEHFNGVKPDGSYWNPNMNSFCHLTLGSVVEWFFGYLLGIRPDKGSIAYEKILIEPVMARSLGFARGGIDTVFGRVCSAWKFQESDCAMCVQIPYGTQATLVVHNIENIQSVVQELNGRGYIETQIDGTTLKIPLAWGLHSFVFPIESFGEEVS